jgi:hypothetical protein
MKQVPDRKKLRREYLKKKIGATAVTGIGGVAFLPCAFFSAVFFSVGLYLFLYFITDLGHRPLSMLVLRNSCAWSLVGLLLAIVARSSWRGIRRSRQDLAALTYIPPITPNTLPADEILVRGSEEPPIAQREVLLRAAKQEETPKEELLRVSRE